MKKILSSVLVVLFVVPMCLAQQTKEDFLNEVVEKLVEFRFRKIYINPKAEGLWKNYHISKEEIKGLFENKIPRAVLIELDEKSNDTSIEYWDCNLLTRAKCTTSELKRKGITLFHKEAKRSRVYISKPILSNDGEWAMVSVGAYCSLGSGFGYGAIYGFHKVNGRWESLGWGTHWMS